MSTTDDRIQRVEEALGFAQHEIEVLSAELRRAFDQIRSMQGRVEALESRTKSLENPIQLPEDERPPHSAGPRTDWRFRRRRSADRPTGRAHRPRG